MHLGRVFVAAVCIVAVVVAAAVVAAVGVVGAAVAFSITVVAVAEARSLSEQHWWTHRVPTALGGIALKMLQ